MSASNWQELDYERVATLIAAGSYSASTAGFLGVFDPGVIPPGGVPQPSVDSDNPTVFAVWGIDYDEVLASMDRNVEPVRMGRVMFEAWAQLGAGQGYVWDLLTQARTALAATPPAGLRLFPDMAAPEFIGNEGDFSGWVLPVRFAGGVA